MTEQVQEELRTAARAAFAELCRLQDPDFPLDQAAAWLAAEEDPGADAAAMLGALDELARGLHVPEGEDPFRQVARLSHHLFTELGFRGDEEDYGNPENSLLHRVVERRRGLPILLSVLTIEIGRRVGVPIEGIGFPGHFLVRHRDADPPFYLDPFHQGKILRRERVELRLEEITGPLSAASAALLAPVSPRQVLVRMNRNLKNSYLERRDLHGVLRAIERLLLLDPSLSDERRDRALLLGQLGRYDVAIAEIEAWLERFPQAQEADRLRAHLAKLVARRAAKGEPGPKGG